MLQFRNCVLRNDKIKQLACFWHKLTIKAFAILICIFATARLHAQTDTTVVDTVSMLNIDSLTRPEADEYADTTIKHIYDTSQYFFNWKDNYSQPYSATKLTTQHLIDEDVKKLKHEDDFWYVPAIEKIEARLKTDAAFRDSLLKASNNMIADNKKDFTQQTWFRFIVWFIIISVFMAAIIYFLLQNKINLFSKDAVSFSQNEESDVQEDIFNLAYSNRLLKAEAQNNHRIAVRLLFLQTLKLLSETNKIKYQPDYTNLDYLQQLYSSDLYQDFFKAVRSYEYIWYGKFEVSPEKYAAIKKDFLMLQNKIA